MKIAAKNGDLKGSVLTCICCTLVRTTENTQYLTGACKKTVSNKC